MAAICTALGFSCRRQHACTEYMTVQTVVCMQVVVLVDHNVEAVNLVYKH